MSQLDEDGNNNQFINIKESIYDVSLDKIDRSFILLDTEKLNEEKLTNKISRMILVRLMYSINQGVQFSEQEVELIFFRVIKLLHSNDADLRRLTYKSLKMLKVQKYIHMIVQSLIKDLMHDNQLIRIEALRFTSIVKDETYIQLLERFIQKAIIDKSQQVSIAALILGIHIFGRFPHIFKQWQSEIQTQLIQSGQINYHALILLQQIKKYNKIQFDDSFEFPRQPQLQLVNLQILKFSVKQEVVISFLNYSIRENVNLIFLESFNNLKKNRNISNIDFEQIIKQFKRIFSIKTNIVRLYSAINKIDVFVKNFQRSKSKIQELISQVEVMTQSPEISISYISILTCMHFQQRNLEPYLIQLFNNNKNTNLQINFMQGLLEVVEFQPEYNSLIINNIKLLVFRDSDYYLKVLAFSILAFRILDNNMREFKIILETLFNLALPFEIAYFQIVVQLISAIFFDIPYDQINETNAQQCYEFLEREFYKGSDYFVQKSSFRYRQIQKQLLSIIENCQKVTQFKEQFESYQNLHKFYDSNSLVVQSMKDSQQIQLLENNSQNRLI